MGIRLPPEPDPVGNACGACWAPGETPVFIYATFSGIVKSPLAGPGVDPPPNSTFKLEQDIITPCMWTYLGDVWEVIYWSSFLGGDGKMHAGLRALHNIALIPGFENMVEAECADRFDNTLAGIPNLYEDGAGWAWWKIL